MAACHTIYLHIYKATMWYCQYGIDRDNNSKIRYASEKVLAFSEDAMDCHMNRRLLTRLQKHHPPEKMILLAGPRQVGKTTLAQMALESWPDKGGEFKLWYARDREKRSDRLFQAITWMALSTVSWRLANFVIPTMVRIFL